MISSWKQLQNEIIKVVEESKKEGYNFKYIDYFYYRDDGAAMLCNININLVTREDLERFIKDFEYITQYYMHMKIKVYFKEKVNGYIPMQKYYDFGFTLEREEEIK